MDRTKGLYMTPHRRRLLIYLQVYAPSESTRQKHKRSAEEYYGNRLLRRFVQVVMIIRSVYDSLISYAPPPPKGFTLVVWACGWLASFWVAGGRWRQGTRASLGCTQPLVATSAAAGTPPSGCRDDQRTRPPHNIRPASRLVCI
jgi:hypothetical protein